MPKRKTSKMTLAVSIDITVVERLKEIAKIEERSVSQIVQRALTLFFSVVGEETNQDHQKAVVSLINRLISVVAVPENCGSQNDLSPLFRLIKTDEIADFKPQPDELSNCNL